MSVADGIGPVRFVAALAAIVAVVVADRFRRPTLYGYSSDDFYADHAD